MKPIERFNLIRDIALKLQATMSTVQINSYLKTHNIATEDTSYVQSKRIYVEQLLDSVSDVKIILLGKDLSLNVPDNSSLLTQHLRDILDDTAMEACRTDFDRAVLSLSTDPQQALGSACSTLESICKGILDKLHMDYPKDQSIQPLVSVVMKTMNLSPDAHADPDIKAILGGLASACQGIGVLRTKSSSAHGKGSKNYILEERHSRLAVNAASTVGIFLLETFQIRFANKNSISELTRREIIQTILSIQGDFYGKLDLIQFLNRIFPLREMPTTDHRSGINNAEDDIRRHMIANNDWDEESLLIDYLGLHLCTDDIFISFLCLVIHPTVISSDVCVEDLVSKMNTSLKNDGFELVLTTKLSERKVFTMRRTKL
jgi:hypothetical protein